MDYLTQYYKNHYLQLQEKLNHLTKMLNEGIVPPRPSSTPSTPSQPSHITRHLSKYNDAAGGSIIRNWVSRLPQFMNVDPADINNLLRSESPQFREFVLNNYGRVIEQGGIYQRQLPDGRIQHWSTTGNWINIDKPGAQTWFGPIGGNGRVLPPEIFGPGLPGHSPEDVSYSPQINPFGSRPRAINVGWGSQNTIGGGGPGQSTGGPVQ